MVSVKNQTRQYGHGEVISHTLATYHARADSAKRSVTTKPNETQSV